MSLFKQVLTILNKNMAVSLRNKDLVMEIGVPIIIALILSLKKQLGPLGSLMPLLYSLALTATYRSILISLVEEKSQRYKEIQKITGLKSSAYTIGWILTGYIRTTIGVIAFEVFYRIFILAFQFDWDLYFYVSFSDYLWPYLIFSFAALNQCFLISSIFNDVKVAGEVQSFFGVAMSFFVFLTYIKNAASSTTYYIIMTILSPQCAIAINYVSGMKQNSAAQEILTMNLFPVSIIRDTYPTYEGGIVLTIMMVIYFILFLYCEQIVPNEYGIAKHPLFFIKRAPKKLNYSINADFESNQQQDQQDISSALYNEELSFKVPPSIQISKLSKEFGHFKAVDNLSLSLYESQIFCLLGHNGAGKTTAINLLTGMIQKTSGQVQMYGMNLDNELECIRKSLGLCNQKDCLYSELTVYEHLKFISGIKGQIDNEEINEIMIKTDLQEECHKQVSQLSGGSKRKLSLAMALVGNSKIIFLDEPTSGMDAFSRRQIWEILERIKADKRTIILTTHHLDEAEILADRIGIMSKGQLLAVGTSEFIKRKFGEGYNLTLTFENSENRNDIYNDVNNTIQNVQFIEDHSSEFKLIFIIPFQSQNNLGELFKILENRNISIGLKMNTLEDAFVKIGMEDEENLLQSKHEDEIKVQRESLGIKDQDIDLFASCEQSIKLPNCLRNPPEFRIFEQLVAIFLRRLFTVIRTSTNYFAIFIPMVAFTFGLAVVAYIDIEDMFDSKENMNSAIEFFKLYLLSCCNILGFSFNATIYITLPVQEKQLNLKQVLQGMGCRMLPYWVGTFLFDFIIYLFFVVLFFVFSAILDIEIVFTYWQQELYCFFSFGFSYILFAYLMGFVFNSQEKALKLYAIFCFFVGFCIPFMVIGFLDYFYQLWDEPESIKQFIHTLQVIFAIFSPFYSFFESFIFINGKFSELNKFYPTPQVTSNTNVYCLIMLGQGLMFLMLIYALEAQLFFIKTKQQVHMIGEEKILEPEVLQEYQRVLQNKNQRTSTIDSIQAIELEKEYIQGQPTLQKITFGVNQSEIFGIIGPNGAGKSTLINSFTGIIQPSNGSALIQGYEPKQQNMAVMQHVGICPQFDCIWENLTPVEHLQLFGRIKGLVGNDLNTAVTYFIETMQLGLFVKTKAGQLSGGNKRKLCVADALIGGSDITFFDEPSTGVDPISRRFLFSTLKRNVQLRNCSAVMTTHTIEEAESLSDRIGILIAGQFKCLGSPEQLRKKYGSGYQITIKCKANAPQDQLESMVKDNFNDSKRIEDKRANHMTFSLSNENFSFYKAFNFFDQIKQDDLISDFQINESSLEQVFIHFSRIQQEINRTGGAVID